MVVPVHPSTSNVWGSYLTTFSSIIEIMQLSHFFLYNILKWDLFLIYMFLITVDFEWHFVHVGLLCFLLLTLYFYFSHFNIFFCLECSVTVYNIYNTIFSVRLESHLIFLHTGSPFHPLFPHPPQTLLNNISSLPWCVMSFLSYVVIFTMIYL